MYAIPAWWGFLNVAEKDRIESVIKKSKRYGYLPSDFENAHSFVESMESKLFDSVRYNTNHVSHLLKRTFICDNDLIPLPFLQKTTI